MASKRGNPTDSRLASITDDPEMQETLRKSSTIAKELGKIRPRTKKEIEAEQMEQYKRVDAGRAKRGLPALPKPGSKEYRR